MEKKIIQVFYNDNCQPYKDQPRQVSSSLTTYSLKGSNLATQLRFYVDLIGGVENTTWVVNVKLPNGKILYQVLDQDDYDDILGENYVIFDLSSEYTQLKGNLAIGLAGYQGVVEIVEDEDTGIYSLVGTPTIQTTAPISLAINYSPTTPLGESLTLTDMQQLLGALSVKSDIANSIVVLSNISSADLSGYSTGQLFYDKTTKYFYQKTTTSPYYVKAEYGVGLLGSKGTILRFDNLDGQYQLTEIHSMTDGRLSIIEVDGVEYLITMSSNAHIVAYDLFHKCWYEYDGVSSYYIGYVFQDQHKKDIASEQYVQEMLENFGNLFTYKGAASVSEINALTNIGNGWCYNLTDSGTLTLGNLQVEQGDNVAFNGTIWTKLSSETVLGNYYTKQEGQEFETQIDNRVDAIENQVQQVASGSPKGVYSTLAALQAAYPTGTTGIFVVVADGHWYYWNGSQWADGGTYQATGIAANSIEKVMLNDELTNNIDYLYDNFFDKVEVVENYNRYGFVEGEYYCITIDATNVIAVQLGTLESSSASSYIDSTQIFTSDLNKYKWIFKASASSANLMVYNAANSATINWKIEHLVLPLNKKIGKEVTMTMAAGVSYVPFFIEKGKTYIAEVEDVVNTQVLQLWTQNKPNGTNYDSSMALVNVAVSNFTWRFTATQDATCIFVYRSGTYTSNTVTVKEYVEKEDLQKK